MTDIVTRLRSVHVRGVDCHCREAADEIVRLRDENAGLRGSLAYYTELAEKRDAVGRCQSSVAGIGGRLHFCALLSGHPGAHQEAKIGNVPPMMWTEAQR